MCGEDDAAQVLLIVTSVRFGGVFRDGGVPQAPGLTLVLGRRC
jgi:hypothetical protein